MLEAIIILKLEENNGIYIYIYIKFFFLDFKILKISILKIFIEE